MSGITSGSGRTTVYGLAFSGILVLSGCAAKYAQVPARMDLQPFGRIGLVSFSTGERDSTVGLMATQAFAEQVLTSQSGIELLEIAATDSLESLLREGDAGTVAKIVGGRHDLPAVFVGRVVLSSVKPARAVHGAGLSVKAGVQADLTVRLLSTRTGGTLWRSSAEASGTVGRMDVSAGMPSIAVRDPQRTYAALVRSMVERVTHDFRPTFIKQ